jgi:hypothetical protein
VQERLFAEFIDPIDMVGCFPAHATLAEIHSAAAVHGLRFPLGCVETATLPEHIRAMEYASGSARFGPLCDNILGMNWVLPSGKRVRVGEQVVKSTTGYDLQRFLLHMKQNFGYPEQFVLRLRPQGTALLNGAFRGSRAALEELCAALRSSIWAHWLDGLDLILMEDALFVEVSVSCLAGEEATFASAFAILANEHRCTFEECASEVIGELPAYCMKCLHSEAIDIGFESLKVHGGVVRILALNGYIQFWPDTKPSADWLIQAEHRLRSTGGHLYGHLISSMPSEQEQAWLTELETKWREL